MNLAAGAALSRGPENRVWYRAIQPQVWPTALHTAQTARFPSRYAAAPAVAMICRCLSHGPFTAVRDMARDISGLTTT